MPDEMKSRITIEGTEEALADLRRVIDAEQLHAREIDNAGDAAAGAARKQDQANASMREGAQDADRLVNGLKGIAGTFTVFEGLRAIIEQVRRELELVIELQDEAFRSQQTLASAQRDLKLNLAGESQETVDAALSAADRIAGDSNISRASATGAFAQAISATGGDIGQAERLTRLAAQIRPDRPDQIGGIAGALGDIGNAIGSENPEEILGFFSLIAKQSRVAESGQQFRNIPKAITGIRGFGFDSNEAGALFSTLTVAGGDLSGEATGTGAIGFAKQLQEFFRDAGRPETGAAAIRVLQTDAELREKFIADLSVEAKLETPITNLLRGREGVGAAFESNIAGLNTDLSAVGRRQIGVLGSGEIEKTTSINRAIESAIDQLDTTDIAGGRAGAVRDKLADVLQRSGFGELATRVAGIEFEVGSGFGSGDVVDSAVDIIERRITSLENPVTTASAGVGAPGIITSRTPTARERQQAGILRGLVSDLQSANGAVINVQGNYVAQQNNLANDGQTPVTAPSTRRDF